MASWRAPSGTGGRVWATAAYLAMSSPSLLCSPVQEMEPGMETCLSACVSPWFVLSCWMVIYVFIYLFTFQRFFGEKVFTSGLKLSSELLLFVLCLLRSELNRDFCWNVVLSHIKWNPADWCLFSSLLVINWYKTFLRWFILISWQQPWGHCPVYNLEKWWSHIVFDQIPGRLPLYLHILLKLDSSHDFILFLS